MRRNLTLTIRGLAAVAAALLVTMVSAPAWAAPTMNVSQLTGLTDGQTLTISGGGFEANLANIAIGQCTADYTGPADCNTSGGATFKNADASGNVSSFTIVVKEVFGGHDCTQVQCVIAAAPLPTSSDAATIKANTVVHDISFGAEETTDPEPTTAPTTTTTTTTSSGDLPKTGAGDSLPVILLAATALLATGAGLMLLLPGRREALR